MDLFAMFKGGKYFDKHIEPKCDYCQFGRRAKDGNKVLCEKRGLVDCSYSCNKFIYSPLKRIPVKQLNFVGSLADEDIYIESAGDRAEKEEANKPVKKEQPKKEAPAQATPAPTPAPAPEAPAPAENAPEAAPAAPETTPAPEAAPAPAENAAEPGQDAVDALEIPEVPVLNAPSSDINTNNL